MTCPRQLIWSDYAPLPVNGESDGWSAAWLAPGITVASLLSYIAQIWLSLRDDSPPGLAMFDRFESSREPACSGMEGHKVGARIEPRAA